MGTLLLVCATLFVFIGTFFSVVAVVGYIRLPDIYTRLHATGKVGIFGVVFLLMVSMLHVPDAWGQACVLILFLVFAGAPTAHAIGLAANRIGLPRRNAVRDDLAKNDNKHFAKLAAGGGNTSGGVE